MSRAFVVACFGDRRKQLKTLVSSLETYAPNIPIHVYTDLPDLYTNGIRVQVHEKLLQWQDHSRAGVRTSNIIKVQATRELKDVCSFCLIDDDMKVMSETFVEGFELAERFGAALPINPRVFVKYLKQSADVPFTVLRSLELFPEYTTACNYSPFFYCKEHRTSRIFMRCLEAELLKGYRGTLAVWVASYKSGYTPLYLPEQWCVCGDYAEHLRDYTIQLKGETVPISPICLHLGHDKVKEIFDEMD
jgi:hypothetical protein